MKTKSCGIAVLAPFAFAMGVALTAYAGPPTNACSLLTSTQVISVLGVKTGPGKALMAKACIWPGAQGKRATLNLISLQAFAAAKTPIGNGITKTEVRGIGDDAVYVSAHGIPTTLTVKKGSAAFTLIVSGFPDDLTKAKEKALALEVCSKL